MTIRTPARTLFASRDGSRVTFPSGVPVDLTDDEIYWLDRDSPGVLTPLSDPIAPDISDEADDAEAASLAARLKARSDRAKTRPSRAGKPTDTEGL